MVTRQMKNMPKMLHITQWTLNLSVII